MKTTRHHTDASLHSLRNLRKAPMALFLVVALSAAACADDDVRASTTASPSGSTTSILSSNPAPTVLVTTSSTQAPAALDLEATVAAYVGDREGGMDVLVVRDGVTSTAAAGSANAKGDPIRPGDLFRVGSVSKPFIATMILQLVDEGQLDLDMPLGSYLSNSPIGADVSIRALLSHRSGLANYTDQPSFFADLFADPDRTLEPGDVLAYVEDLPAAPAGERFSYSNTNYILLGRLIEHVDETDLNHALDSRITKPLGLTATAFDATGNALSARSVGAWSPGLLAGEVDAHYGAISSSAWAAGALISSTGDLATFLTALMNGDLISDASLQQMTETGVDGYGLGLAASVLGPDGRGYAHSGAIPGYSSTMAINPENGDILVILTNNDSLNADQFAAQLLRKW